MNNNKKADIIAGICNGVVLRNSKEAPAPELTGEEWEEVLEMASAQGVLPVMIHRLNVAPPTSILMGQKQLLQWIGVSLQMEQNYKIRVSVMRELAALFDSEDMDVMFMKGAALAQLYPCPEWRVFSDIDYYLFGKSEQGIRAMARKGIENSAYYHHHTQASLEGVLLENHYDFVERVNHKCDIILDDALKTLAVKEGRTIPATFLGRDIKNAYLMSPTMNAIFLMRHMSAHFVSETILLRQLYDWAIFLQKHAKEVDWPYVQKLYDESSMTEFVGIVMQLLCTYLEYENRDCPLTPERPDVSQKVWESIISPPARDPYRKFSIRYYLFETRTFFANHWKHRMVYPDESYTLLFFKYAWLGIKKMTGTLKIENKK